MCRCECSEMTNKLSWHSAKCMLESLLIWVVCWCDCIMCLVMGFRHLLQTVYLPVSLRSLIGYKYLYQAWYHIPPPPPQFCSSASSPQSLSPSHIQVSGIQDPLGHWNWPESHPTLHTKLPSIRWSNLRGCSRCTDTHPFDRGAFFEKNIC